MSNLKAKVASKRNIFLTFVDENLLKNHNGVKLKLSTHAYDMRRFILCVVIVNVQLFR